MLNHELCAEFRDCLGNSKVFIVNPGIDQTDHERWGIGKVTFLPRTEPGNEPEDTIIETGPDSMRVEEFVTLLGEQDSDGTVQVFIKGWEGQNYAYFDIARVRRGPYHHSIILGDWRCGG